MGETLILGPCHGVFTGKRFIYFSIHCRALFPAIEETPFRPLAHSKYEKGKLNVVKTSKIPFFRSLMDLVTVVCGT